MAVDPADVNQLLIEAQTLPLRKATDGATFTAAVSGITEPAGTFPYRAHLSPDPTQASSATVTIQP